MKLIIDHGTVFGSYKYHTVKPIIDDLVYNNSETWDRMIGWCVDNYGPAPTHGVWEPNERWYANNAKFWFRDDEDLTLFVLRWS